MSLQEGITRGRHYLLDVLHEFVVGEFLSLVIHDVEHCSADGEGRGERVEEGGGGGGDGGV